MRPNLIDLSSIAASLSPRNLINLVNDERRVIARTFGARSSLSGRFLDDFRFPVLPIVEGVRLSWAIPWTIR